MNIVYLLIWWAFGWPFANHLSIGPDSLDAKPHRYLYVAVPGIRNYLEYGGHGILVYDIDKGHKFVKRISTQGMGLERKYMYQALSKKIGMYWMQSPVT